MNESTKPVAIFDVAVVGGGPAGLAAAIALSRAGARTALIARRVGYGDNRTTALLGGSVDLLRQLDVWPRCEADAAALRVMRLVDDTRRLIRAPEVRFSSDEIGLDAFGYNIENRTLMAAMEARAVEAENLTRIDGEAEHVTPDDTVVTIATRQGETLTARLAIGADGRQSLCRKAAGIGVTRRALDQAALTFNVAHSRPHKNISTEFHTPHGPCVFVPLPGDRSSVVWVASPKEAARLAALTDDELVEAAERQSHSILGRLQVGQGRSVFPLGIEQPARFASNRIVLVGEAAHVLPPIGAQGLNLGLRDAADIADVVRDALSSGKDPGASQTLARFETARRSDVLSRSFAIDMANRSLLSDFLPIQTARALGLHLISKVGPLRRLAMREGLSPSWRQRPYGETGFGSA
ncbi:UbiH/UbiF family hydroxylase [Nitrobacter vulgaris]|uniref:2-octaprenyl-6-methoxyphenyl hydroxylase n=1 Tax=Nitrobacter vulgaris TaxID=29421 RepID=A0A1V4I084_NITVU|nr:UbiH/UbiF family hydroxylase [Nitrobacter vulgaris]OPH83232.1 2-octaprenyl-6-methoxyphenyl hydroxylase [Nitrobacter vulgaris]